MSKIIEFQKNNGLSDDGIIGKKTLNMIRLKLKIQSDEELANFMGQISHETGNFRADTENLNYSANGLMKIFKKYFTLSIVGKYTRNPEKIGSRVYANRMGNGDEASKEGFIFRGRGSLQLTGKNNYKLFSDFIGEDCVKNPELVATKYYFESAKFYFDTNKLWSIAKKVDVKSITSLSKAINLGNRNSRATPNGLEDRIDKTNEFYKILKK